MNGPDKLAARRKALGLTLQEVADLAGISGGASHVWKIETGAAKPMWNTWAKIKTAIEKYEDQHADGS